VGSIIRLIMRSAVVLPLPDEPTKTVNLPFGTARLSWATAVVPSAKTLLTLSKMINVFPRGFRTSLFDLMVEAVVPQPVPCCLIGIDARVPRHRGVESGYTGGGQLRRHSVQHIFEAVRLLLRIDQGHNVAGQKVVLWVFECHQVVLQYSRRRAENVGGGNPSVHQCAYGHRTAAVVDGDEVARPDVESVLLPQPW